MIKIHLTNDQHQEIEAFRKQASSKNSEKASMVLLSNDGKSVSDIALMLKRNHHTVRNWLKRYKAKGIKGLNCNFSPGRPGDLRKKARHHLENIIGEPPISYGYQDRTWTVPLITFEINKTFNMNASTKTVTRALIDMGYVYKRPSKTVPGNAPDKEEKQKSVKEMVQEILRIIDREESIIYALDESHFSTEPYLVRGWFKKRWPPSDVHPQKERESHLRWVFEYQNTKILLEKIDEIGQ
ncbi:MAG: IS630 family transposase [Desulfobacula sp.]|jgi:transposase